MRNRDAVKDSGYPNKWVTRVGQGAWGGRGFGDPFPPCFIPKGDIRPLHLLARRSAWCGSGAETSTPTVS